MVYHLINSKAWMQPVRSRPINGNGCCWWSWTGLAAGEGRGDDRLFKPPFLPAADIVCFGWMVPRWVSLHCFGCLAVLEKVYRILIAVLNMDKGNSEKDN
jgi:hypothetical protein